MASGLLDWMIGPAEPPQTRLMTAAATGNAAEVASLILKAPAQPNNGSGCPIHAACENGHADVITVILECMPMEMLRPVYPVCQSNTDGQMLPVHLVCKHGHLEALECLLVRQTPMEWPGAPIHPIHLAAINGHALVIERLIQYGCAVDHLDREGNTPLHNALGSPQYKPDVVATLLQHGAGSQHRCPVRIAEKLQLGESILPIHVLCQMGDVDALRLLVQRTGDVGLYQSTAGDDLGCEMYVEGKFTRSSGMLPLHIACSQGSEPVVRVLVEASTDHMLRLYTSCYCTLPDGKHGDHEFMLPIHLACLSGDIATVTTLLEVSLPGLDAVTIPDEKHGTRIHPLMSHLIAVSGVHLAAEHGHQDLMEFLLMHNPAQPARTLRAAALQDAAAQKARLYWSRFGFANKVWK